MSCPVHNECTLYWWRRLIDNYWLLRTPSDLEILQRNTLKALSFRYLREGFLALVPKLIFSEPILGTDTVIILLSILINSRLWQQIVRLFRRLQPNLLLSYLINTFILARNSMPISSTLKIFVKIFYWYCFPLIVIQRLLCIKLR